MSTTLGPLISTKVVSNLDTYDYTVAVASSHVVSVRVTIPLSSSLIITIKQGATTIATSVAPTPRQRVVTLSATISTAVSDVLHVQMASTSANDSAKNVLKGIINIHQGSKN